MWSMPTTDGHRAFVGHEPDPHAVQAVAFSPDGRTVAASTFNGEDPATNHVSIWDWKAGKIVRELDAVGVSSMDYDGSGDRLALGFFDGTVQIRDASTGDIERSFGAGSVTVMDIVFSPDGQMLATSGEDAAVRLFDLDVETGAQQLVLRGHQLLVSGVDFSPDGKRLASASGDGVVRVWALDLDELIAIAEDELTRPLTDDECRQYLNERAGLRVKEIPQTRYAKAPDGTSIAYQVVGDGPVDLVYSTGIWSNLEVMWEHPLWASYLKRLVRFSRLILFDMRGSDCPIAARSRPCSSCSATTSGP